MLPPHAQGRINIEKRAGQPDPVAPGTTEGPIEQGLCRLQADSPKEDQEMKGTTASPLLPVESAGWGCVWGCACARV